MNRTSLALLGVMLLAVPAAGKTPNYTRNSTVKVNVHLSERTKPHQQKLPDVKDQKPTLTADAVLSIEGLVGNIRGEQEQILVELIQNTPDSEGDEKSDYYFRLGELYAKQQRYWRLKSAEMMIARDNARNRGVKAKYARNVQIATQRAKNYLLKAVRTYKGLTDNPAFRNYPKMDQALFYYGYTLTGGKYMKEARQVYDKLLRNYPRSKYVPEAHLAFADYYFEQNQLADAEQRYKMVLKFPKSSAYQYAKYKLGWIDLNLSRFQQALELFFEVAQATKRNKKQAVLNRAAKKDFVRAYAEIGKADKAYPAFQRVDRKYAFTMLGILADHYMGQGKSDKAIYTYQSMMKIQPRNKNVCLWQYNIAQAMLSMKGSSNAEKVKEIENLVRLWGGLKNKRVLPKAEAQECHDNAAAMSGELARAYHSESAKTKNTETLAYAERLYKVYLDVFPDAKDYAQTQYYYAELLWARAEGEKNPRLQTELWETAANAFTDVVKKGKVGPKLTKEAAYAAVLGWKNALNVDPRVKNQADKVEDIDKEYSKIPPPKPIPERQKKMMDAFDIYIKYIKNPKDDELVGMKFLKANLYRRYNHFDEAIPLFMDILEHHREHETAEFAANLLLDTYNRMGKYDEMLALVDKLDGDKKFLDGKEELATTLGKIKAQSLRKKAEHIEKVAKETKNFAKYVECGQAYLDIYNRNPTDDANDEVLYNALTCYQEGKSIGAAIQMFGLLKQYYPKSKLMPRAIGRIGKAYGDIAFYEQAADKLEEYARKYGGEKDAFKALSEAVFYRKGIGQDKKAIDDTNFFLRQYGRKKPKEASDAMFSLTSVYEKQGNPDAIVKHLRNYIRQFPARKGGSDRIVIAYAKIGKLRWDQSCPKTLVNGSCVKIQRERALASRRAKRRRRGNDQPTQCGPESKIKLTVIKRDPRKVKEALAAFKAAEREFERTNGKTGGDEAGARYYYAQSKFAEADAEFEKYLDLKFPKNLNFDPKNKAVQKKSLKRFNDWVEKRKKVGAGATQRYEAILGIKDAATSIAAAARLAQVSQNLSDALFSASIPQDVRTGQFADEKVEAFCDKMTEVAEPLDLRALQGYTVCLTKSTELGWFSEWSKMCEHELGQIKPEEFPTASELRGDPMRVAPVIDVEPPIGKLE